MSSKPTVFLVEGPPGTGKSYERAARWLVDDFLPNREGHHFSNFPLNVDAIAEYCERVHKLPKDQTAARLHFIDPAALADWRDEVQGSGPWVYFADRPDGTNPLERAHVAIDECHVYLGVAGKSSAQWRKQWEGWLGTIRHRGCTIEFLTQDVSKVAKEITAHCESKIVLSTLANQRVPFIGIRATDAYQVLSKLRGKSIRVTVVDEYQRRGARWAKVEGRVNVLDQKYFALYDSFGRTEHGDSGAQQEPDEWERFGWLRFFALVRRPQLVPHHLANSLGCRCPRWRVACVQRKVFPAAARHLANGRED